MSFLCMLWPYLAGGLIGWLLAGWFARRLKNSPAPVERVVEKHVDKIVDNPEHLALISKLQDQVANGQKSVAPAAAVVAPTVIDLKAAKAAGLKIKSDTDFTVIEGIGPQINNLIHDAKISTFTELADSDVPRIQKILDDAGPRFKIANPGTWPDQAHLVANNRWSALKALQDVLDGGVYPNTTALKKSAAAGASKSAEKTKAVKEKVVAKIDTDAAKAAGFKVKQKDGQDDFTVVEGIGPKINGLIHADNIHTFTELSKTKVEVIQGILDKAGPSYKMAKPGTWPKQAEMAANNQWDALKAWQDELDGGV